MANNGKQDEINLSLIDLRVLVALLVGPMTGYEVAKQCQQDKGEKGSVSRGAVYPSLKRLTAYGLVTQLLPAVSAGRLHKLTPPGREMAALELGELQALVQLGRERLRGKRLPA